MIMRALYSIAAKTGQLLLHGFIHEVDEAAQRVVGAASRAAEMNRSSGPCQLQQTLALLASELLLAHPLSLFGCFKLSAAADAFPAASTS
jgi:hypothetical protein